VLEPLVRADRRYRASGFTLLEMLVVLLIMGLTVGLVTAIVRPDDRQLLRMEADRLAQLLDLASSEAQVAGTSIGWTSDGKSYRFWRVSDAGDWYEIRDAGTLRPRSLPTGMQISGLSVESMRQPGTMRLEFGAYVPSPAFAIELTFGNERCAVTGSPIGQVRVVEGAATSNGRVALR
jgi:general secretion pathway protein H